MKKLIAVFGLAVSGISASFAQQNIVSFGSVNPSYVLVSSYSYTFGYEFEVTSPIMVTGLSVFSDPSPPTYNSSAFVGLWDANQNLLETEDILTGDAAQLTTDRFFRYKSLDTPIILQDGFYYVGAYVRGTSAGVYIPFTYNVNGLNSISGVTYISPQESTGPSISFPYYSVSQFTSSGMFGGNVVGYPLSVPESGPAMLLFTGLFTVTLYLVTEMGELDRLLMKGALFGKGSERGQARPSVIHPGVSPEWQLVKAQSLVA